MGAVIDTLFWIGVVIDLAMIFPRKGSWFSRYENYAGGIYFSAAVVWLGTLFGWWH